MASTKLHFQSSREKRTRVRKPVSGLLFYAVALPVAFLFFQRAHTPQSQSQTYVQNHRSQLDRLKDMILEEKNISTVGRDRLGNFRLVDGRWIDGRKDVSREEAFRAAGIARERFAEYVRLLKSVGAYRVSRASGSVKINLIDDGAGARTVIFSPGESWIAETRRS